MFCSAMDYTKQDVYNPSRCMNISAALAHVKPTRDTLELLIPSIKASQPALCRPFKYAGKLHVHLRVHQM